MKEVQAEALVIEEDMSQRFKGLLLQNEAKRRHMPSSLTSEIEAHKQSLEDSVNQVPTYNQTRELIT